MFLPRAKRQVQRVLSLKSDRGPKQIMAKKKKTMIKIQQVRSSIGRPIGQRETLRGLGLRRIRHVVEREDTVEIRGMVAKISHLAEVVEESK